jgi:WD40 repeat protein
MRTFSAGEGRVHALAYSPDSRSLVVDLRAAPGSDSLTEFDCSGARELVWWDWLSGTARRRFRLRDSLYGPGGALTGPDDYPDSSPEEAAIDASFCVRPWRVATAWDWTDKEDGVCVFDPDRQQVIDLRTPYKTHTVRLALAPDGNSLAAATFNDMDGSGLLEVWDLTSNPRPPVEPGTLSPWELARRQRIWDEQRGCPNPFDRLAALAFDGRFVATAGTTDSPDEETEVLVWDSGTPPPSQEWDDEVEYNPGLPLWEVGFEPLHLAFAPGASLLAAGGAGLALQDPATGRSTTLERSGAPVSALAFAAEGKLLLAGTEAGAVEIWDAAAGRLARGFNWSGEPITAVAFAPDGQTCAAGTSTGAVIIWDAE